MLKNYIVNAEKEGIKQYGLLLVASSPEHAIVRAKQVLPKKHADCLLTVALDQDFGSCKGCDEALFADDICPDCGNFAGIN